MRKLESWRARDEKDEGPVNDDTLISIQPQEDLCIIDEAHMRKLIDKIPDGVPRTLPHLRWRLALVLKYDTEYVNRAERSCRTWSELAKVFESTKSEQQFRYEIVNMWRSHDGHDDPDFNVLTCEAKRKVQPERKELTQKIATHAVSRETLKNQMLLTLEERAKLLSVQNGVPVTVYKLREMYRDACITRKQIKYKACGMKARELTIMRRQSEARLLRERYQAALKLGCRILYLDEVMFQTRSEFKG